jgi:mono/diheme cytochrome c family protein
MARRQQRWGLALLLVAGLAVGCSPARPSVAGGGAPAAQPATGPTAGQLASRGREVYVQQCAVCHGDQGQGLTAPAVIGASANLGKYATARGLYDYTRVSMPQTAPGSLSAEAYQQVVGYLLVQNGFVPANAALTESTLDSIRLQR